MNRPNLPQPAHYFPVEKGVYEVAPGLRTLGTDLGNGERDGLVFQLDAEWERYRSNKLECRAERLSKYDLSKDYDPRVAGAVAAWIARRLATEHPAQFALRESDSGAELDCALTGERLRFDAAWALAGVDGARVSPAYSSALDALASQVQEDIAVMVAPSGRAPWLAALHLCAPSHWSGEEKIGQGFEAIHLPVPGIEKVNRAAASLVDAMIRKGPYVRFVWGFATDRQLNHHPEPPPGISHEQWNGRRFRLGETKAGFILRMERQCTVGLPEVDASIFTIRPYFMDGAAIREDARKRELLRSALLSMNEESLRYKGLRDSLGDVIAWLDGAPSGS